MMGDLTARNSFNHSDKNESDGPGIYQTSSSSMHQTLSMSNRSSSDVSNNTQTQQKQSKLIRWSLYLLLGGIILGLILPKNTAIASHNWQILSNIIGYTYFLSWSASFYPQMFLNYQRQTTRGLSVDFCTLNVLGYICYTVYTTNFYWNQNVIQAYRDRSHGEITVQGNDVAFALHAILMASITLSQIQIYDTFAVRPPSRGVYIVLLCTASFCLLYILGTWMYNSQVDMLGFLYVLGTIKIGVTVGKYVPQALLNRSRQSTVGWNVFNVILDLTGGILSLLQLVGDCAAMNDWSGIYGNPAKLALSVVTITFDLIFLVQHYILYPDAIDETSSSYSALPSIESTGIK